jgi:dTDP-4-dehydrorhamnose reductase
MTGGSWRGSSTSPAVTGPPTACGRRSDRWAGCCWASRNRICWRGARSCGAPSGHHEIVAADVAPVVESSGGEVPEGVDVVAADITDRDAVLGLLTSVRPDAVVHPGAFTAVDRCESEVETAYRVNVIGTRHVAEGARRVGAPVLYLSTDYVFDGTKAEPYLEWDEPAPRSVYGRTKLAGERELDPGSTVVRTSWVCGFHGQNMVKTILRLAGEHDTLTFVDDQRGHPTFAGDLATMIRRLVVDRRPGTFHVTNQGAVSWYEFAQAVLEAAGDDPARVKPIATADLHPPRPAPRPANSVLDNAALRLSGVPLLRDFREPLAEVVTALRRPA